MTAGRCELGKVPTEYGLVADSQAPAAPAWRRRSSWARAWRSLPRASGGQPSQERDHALEAPLSSIGECNLSLYAQYAALLDGVLDELVAEGALPEGLERRGVTVEPPRDAAHGDLATNAAMVLAKGAKTNPRALAEAIKSKLEALAAVTSVEVAGPGFINLRLMPDAWRDELRTILRDGDRYGLSDAGRNERVNVEYVSANPTGPLHVGHYRCAVVGDTLARVLEAAGFRVTKEYYLNDAGAQVDTLARSLHLRYRETLGENIGEIPEGLYPGDYLKPVGALLAAQYGYKYAAAPETEWLELFKDAAMKAMLDLIRHDLALLDIH